MKILISIFTLFAIAKSIECAFSFQDVCNRKDLCYWGTNIACQANSIKLCAGGKMITFTAVEKSELVDQHNKLRNDLAAGRVKGFSSATRMGAMAWDDELAAMADLNMRRCVYGHDQCHNTRNYPMSGQNLAYVKGYGHGTFNRAAVYKEFNTMISDWFSEYKYADMNIIRKYRSDGRLNLHFTTMSMDRNTRVGCAGFWYPEDGTGRGNFGCNYATLTMMDEPVYVDGPIGSKCKSGRDQKFSFLCSVAEKY